MNKATSLQSGSRGQGYETKRVQPLWLQPPKDRITTVSRLLREWRCLLRQKRYYPSNETTQHDAGFPYNPIDGSKCIRVLELLPGSPGSSLRGRLLTEPLESVAPFEAVSYSWGSDISVVDHVYCNGDGINITAAVSRLLQQFRSSQNSRRLWIDAICIDQSKQTEKDAQVPLMEDIYRKASTVLIWLGPEDQNTAESYKLIQRAHRCIESAQEQHGEEPSMEQLFACGLPGKDDPKWRALDALLDRPWFKRTWVLQEVALAQKAVLYCGHHTCEWKILAHVANIMFFTNTYNLVGVWNLTHPARIAMIAFLDPKTVDKRLLGLLIATLALQVSDRRDRVYALLGLANDGAAFTHLIDYDSKRVETLFSEVCEHYLNHGVTMILNYAGDTPFRGTRHLPSWTPDWSASHRNNSLAAQGYHLRPNLLQCEAPHISHHGRILHIKGLVIDRVQSVGRTLGMKTSWRDARIIQRWCRLATTASPGLYPTGGTYLEAFARTLVVQNSPAFSPSAFSSMSALYEAYQIQNFPRSSHPPTMSSEQAAEVFRYMGALRLACAARSFFISRSGYMGLGSYFLRSGDLIVELHEGLTPFALRKVRGGKYKLLGEVYLHGRMNAEGLNVREAREFEIV